jgi:ketopantoate hydroxymethyltransferase
MAVEVLCHPSLSLHPSIEPYIRRYESPAQTGLKINLYRAVEVEGLAVALDTLAAEQPPVECVMVGDSYFMTHLGRSTTALNGEAEREEGLDTLVGLVTEVRGAVEANFSPKSRPFVLADLPDGTVDTPAGARAAAGRFFAAGADAVKIEFSGPVARDCITAVTSDGAVFGHLGYTPQSGTLRRHGNSPTEASQVFAQARQIRDAGACGLIVEMVSEPVNQALSRPDARALPVYSIFSGRARWGGQSLNAWDAVVKSPRPARHFPPTAVIDRSEVPEEYTAKLIGDRLAELMQMTLSGWYPRSPRTSMSESEVDRLAEAGPWTES